MSTPKLARYSNHRPLVVAEVAKTSGELRAVDGWPEFLRIGLRANSATNRTLARSLVLLLCVGCAHRGGWKDTSVRVVKAPELTETRWLPGTGEMAVRRESGPPRFSVLVQQKALVVEKEKREFYGNRVVRDFRAKDMLRSPIVGVPAALIGVITPIISVAVSVVDVAVAWPLGKHALPADIVSWGKLLLTVRTGAIFSPKAWKESLKVVKNGVTVAQKLIPGILSIGAPFFGPAIKGCDHDGDGFDTMDYLRDSWAYLNPFEACPTGRRGHRREDAAEVSPKAKPRGKLIGSEVTTTSQETRLLPLAGVPVTVTVGGTKVAELTTDEGGRASFAPTDDLVERAKSETVEISLSSPEMTTSGNASHTLIAAQEVLRSP